MNESASVERVLVHVGLDRLGDGLLKLPFVRELRRVYPSAHLTWFAGKETSVYARALAPLVSGLLDEVIEYGGVGIAPGELIRRRPLAGRRFDLVIDTQRIFWTSLSARRIRHGRFISPAARFLLSSKKPPSGYTFPKSMQRQMLDLLALASGEKIEPAASLQLDIPAHYRRTAARLLPEGPRYAGFAPGSGGRPKCWPLARFMDAAAFAERQGLTPVFIIGPQEEDWIHDIKARLPDAVLPLQDGGGDTRQYDPLLTIALGARLSVAVSNDSGIAHMLAVAGAPLIALYGPTVHEKFPPMTDDIDVIRAETFGSREMTAIPLDAVTDALGRRAAAAPPSGSAISAK